jgi:predicted nucleic acid-binding protein
MLLYLDNCCFNRPFDDQKQIRIRIETEAKLYIQENIVLGQFKLAWSYMLDYENNANPYYERKETIKNWKKHSVIDTNQTEDIILLANKLHNTGIKSKDALHVACATIMNCTYFITTDINLLKKLRNFEKIKALNPVEFINHLENT